MAHDPYPAHLTRRHLLQLLGTGAGLGLLPRTAVAALAQSARAAATPGVEDWPEFGGKGRLDVWNETGILDTFPKDGLKVLWRTPVRSRLCRAGRRRTAASSSIDYVETKRPRGPSAPWRSTRKPASFSGPRNGMSITAASRGRSARARRRPSTAIASTSPAPTASCSASTSRAAPIIWKKDYVKDYGADRRKWAFDWGFASAPMVDGNRLIALVGGQPDAKVVAFDKMTGKEIWRALPSTSDPGVAQPIIITAGRHPAADHLASRRRRVARPGDRQDVLGRSRTRSAGR